MLMRTRRHARCALLSLVAAAAAVTPVRAASASFSKSEAITWSAPVAVAKGNQFDAAVGPDGSVHIIADEYVHYGPDLRKVLTSREIAAGQKGDLSFAPAIAVDTKGAVHVLTRHGGDFNTGHQIRYRRRSPRGVWNLDLEVGRPKGRNYVVAITTTPRGRVFVSHAWAVPGKDMVSYIDFYEIAEGAVRSCGTLEGRYHRADDRFRMRAVGPHHLHVVAGNPWPRGRVNYFVGAPAAGEVIPRQRHTFSSGEGRKGQPYVYVDAIGTAHLTYGSKHQVWYNRLRADGTKLLGRDVLLADGLGDWHLSIGMSAVAGTDDGKGVVAVMLRSPGNKTASDAEILWCHSVDGGARWTAASPTGFKTGGGEGRKAPVLLAARNRAFLLYSSDRQVHLSHVALPLEQKPKGSRRGASSRRTSHRPTGTTPDTRADAPSGGLTDDERTQLRGWAGRAGASIRQRIVAATGAGKRISVSGALAGPSGRGTVTRADAEALTVRTTGVTMRVPWARVRPRDLYSIALKVSKPGDETLDVLAFAFDAGLRRDVTTALRASSDLRGADAARAALLRRAVGLPVD